MHESGRKVVFAMPKKQKSGLYRSKVKVGTKPDGSPLTKWVSGRTKAEFEDAKRAIKEYYIAGTGLRPDRMFGEYTIEWYRVHKEPRLSSSSKNGYRSMLNKYVLPAFGDRNLRAITATELQDWINGFAGMSDSSITLVMTILSGVFSAAKSDRIIDQSPAADLTKPEAGKKTARRALTGEETGALLRLIDGLLGDPERIQDALYLATMYYLGVRPGEARGLQWGDFDWDADRVHIQRDIDYTKRGDGNVGELKTDAADRTIPVPAALRNILYPRRELPGTFLLRGSRSGKPLSSASAARIWIRCMVDLGLARRREQADDKRDIRDKWDPIITPHYLRHNYITMCWEAGLDPLVTMRIVGHKDYRTTANVYTHLNEQHIQSARDEIESVFADRAKNKVAQKLHKRCAVGNEQK